MRSLIRILAPVALAVAFIGAIAPASTGAQESGGSLTIHSRTCPTTIVIDDLFDDCHDTAAGNLEFLVDGPGLSDTVTVDAAGNATVGPITSGDYAISGGVPGEFARSVAYCSVDGVSDDDLVEVPAGTSFTARVAEGLVTTCDVYAFPEDLRGDTPTPAPAQPTATPGTVKPTATRAPVTTLPSTGSGDVTSGDLGAMTIGTLLGALVLVGGAVAYGLRPRMR